jgi:hypothetical protein
MKDDKLWWRAAVHRRTAGREEIAADAPEITEAVLALVTRAMGKGWLSE